MYYDNVPESFLINSDFKSVRDELEGAIDKICKVPGGALFCQLRAHLITEDECLFSIEGAWFPPEFADKLANVINEWRASRGIPAKEQAHV